MRKNVGKNSRAKPTDFLMPGTEYATKEKATERFDICSECPNLIRVTNQCKLCGCFMKLKVKLANAECPINKW